MVRGEVAERKSWGRVIKCLKCRALGGRRGIPRLPAVAEILAAHGQAEIAREVD